MPFSRASINARDDRGILAHAVKSLLDGEHVVVAGSGADEIDDRTEAIVGMVEKDVAAAQDRKDVLAGGQHLRDGWNKSRVFQVRSIDLHQFHGIGQTQRPVHRIDLIGLQLHVLDENVATRSGMATSTSSRTALPK